MLQVAPEYLALVGPLLGAYAWLASEWDAWHEDEDEAVLQVIDAACQLAQCQGGVEQAPLLLLASHMPATPAPMEG